MRSWLHSLVAVQSHRPAWALGARMATIVVVPLAVGLATNHLSYGLIATLGALNVGITDPGGADRLRARALVGATIAEALTLALGTLVGPHAALAIPVMFLVAFAAGMAGAFGEVVGNVAFFSAVMFILGIGMAGDIHDALDRLWLVGLGGAWAMVLCLALWPVRPLRPAQLAVGAAYRSIAQYLGRFGGIASGGFRPKPGRTLLGAGEPRAKLAAARDTIQLVEGFAAGARPAARTLEDVCAEGDAILARCEALAAQVVRLPEDTPAAMREELARAVLALGGQAGAVETVLTHPRRAEHDPRLLEQALDDLDAGIVAARAQVAQSGEAEVRDVLAFRGIELTLREAAALTDRAEHLAHQAVSERHRREAFERAERERRSSGGPRAWIARLRAELHPSSMLLRHSLRFATALAAGMGVAALLDLQRGYWIDITIAVILRPYLVTTFERGLQRVVGTVLGGFLAALLLSTVSGDVAVVLVLLALAFATFACLPLNYGWAVTFLTPLVVLLVGFAFHAGPGIAVDRIVDTLIGCAIAVTAALLLWPRSERPDFAAALVTALQADRDYLDAVLAGGGASAAQRRAASAADDLEARYRRLAGEPRRGRDGLAAAWEAVAGVRRLYVATVALETQLGRAGADTDLRGIGRALDGAVDAIAAALRQGHAPGDAADAVDEALAGLRADVAALVERRTHELAQSPDTTETTAVLRRRALVLAELDASAAALHRVQRAAASIA
jgi:uncharacterized membrane protein YccC